MSCARRPSFPFIGRASKPGGLGRDEEGADPLRPLAARPGEDDRRLGPRAERDEDLRAGQHPVVAVAFGSGGQRSRVGAAAGLGERVAAERLAGCQPRQQRRASARRSPTSRPSCRRARSRPRRSRAPTSRRGRAPRRAGSTRPSRARRRRAPPAAPAARKPASASVATSERGSSSASSQARACGTSSRSQSSRAEARISSCSGVSVKSMRNDVGAVAGPHDPFISACSLAARPSVDQLAEQRPEAVVEPHRLLVADDVVVASPRSSAALPAGCTGSSR